MSSKLCMVFLTLILVVITGCGGNPLEETTATSVSEPIPVIASGQLGLMLPGEAISLIPPKTSSNLLLELTGSEYTAGLTALVSNEATSARYSPAWVDSSSGFESLAYAVYSFNVQGYSGIEEVILEWGVAPVDVSKLWVGLSHWASNSWSWHAGPSAGTLDLDGGTYSDYAEAESGDLLVAIVMLGTDQVVLDKLSVGEAAIQDWTMFGHDLQHTSRSPYIGAQTNNLKWSFTTAGEVHASPVIDVDGTVYIGSYDGNLYAINPDGTEKWVFSVGGLVDSSAAVGVDGTIYIGASTPVKKLFAINPDGTEKWAFSAVGNVNSSPVIAADGTIYVGCGSNKFYAINPDGTEKWSVPQAGIVESSPAIATDGTIYIGGTDLLALNPDGTEQWTFITDGWIRASPTIGADGTIYAGTPNNFFYAVNPDGSEKWSFDATSEIVSSAAIALDGTVYFGSFGNKLYALNPDGSEEWAHSTVGNVWSSPALDADGTIYFGISFGAGKFQAVNPDGTQKWEYTALDRVASSPAIAANGTVYVGSLDGKLYAFKDAP